MSRSEGSDRDPSYLEVFKDTECSFSLRYQVFRWNFACCKFAPPLSEHSWDRVKTFPKSHGNDVIPPHGSAVQIFLLTGTGMVVNYLKVIGSNPSGHSRM